MMSSESDDAADRPPQYSLRQLCIAVSICSMAAHVGLTAAVLLALIAVQAICFLLLTNQGKRGVKWDKSTICPDHRVVEHLARLGHEEPGVDADLRGRQAHAVVGSHQAEHIADLLEADREISPADRAEHRVRSGQNLHTRNTSGMPICFSDFSPAQPL